MGGGILSVHNEKNIIVTWVCVPYLFCLQCLTRTGFLQRFCQSQSPEEIAEALLPLKQRFLELGAPEPEMVIADNCCQVARRIRKVFLSVQVGLDIFHCLKRFVQSLFHLNQ